jgi:hypothetical protein
MTMLKFTNHFSVEVSDAPEILQLQFAELQCDPVLRSSLQTGSINYLLCFFTCVSVLRVNLS